MEGKTEMSANKRIKPDIGNFDFLQVLATGLYVDQTGFLSAYIKGGQRAISVTAPKRFGKTILLSTAKTFFGIEVDERYEPITDENHSVYVNKRSLFEKLEIGKDQELMKQHLGKYVVLNLDFGKVGAINSKDDLNHAFNGIMLGLFRDNDYLSSSKSLNDTAKGIFKSYAKSINDPAEAFDFYITCLSKHFKNAPLFLLIDEVDLPITNCLFDPEFPSDDFEKVVNFVGILLGRLCKFSKIPRVILTGCSHYGGLLTKDANNVKQHNFVHSDFGRYYGYTLEEVKKLFRSADVLLDVKTLESWYGGYTTTAKSTGKKFVLFNPWSVLNYICDLEYKEYWPESQFNELAPLLAHRKIMNVIMEKDRRSVISFKDKLTMKDCKTLRFLMYKQSEFLDRSLSPQDVDLIFFFLLQAGCLSYENGLPQVTSDFRVKVKIPNAETGRVLDVIILYHMRNNNKTLGALIDGFNVSLENFASGIGMVDEQMAIKLFKLFDALKKNHHFFENEPSCLHVLAMVLRAGFKDVHVEYSFYLDGENAGQIRRTDIFLQDANLVIEVKYRKLKEDVEKGTRIALKDIKERMYDTLLDASKKRSVTGVCFSESAEQIGLAGLFLDVGESLQANFHEKLEVFVYPRTHD